MNKINEILNDEDFELRRFCARLGQKMAFLLRMILTTYGLESFPTGETNSLAFRPNVYYHY